MTAAVAAPPPPGALPSFPSLASPARALPDQAALRRAGLSLRAAADADLPFLAAVHASTPEAERAIAGWPDDAWDRFVAAQFALQHRNLVRRFAAADFLVVVSRSRAIGRFYLDRSGPVWRILEIALLSEARAAGAGAALVRWVQRAARHAGADAVDLHVLHANPDAARFYARLGFVDGFSTVPTHRRMAWTPPRVG